jgi:Ca-activated chloride channel family protein
VLLTDGKDTASLVTHDQVVYLGRHSEIGICATCLRDSRSEDRIRPGFSRALFLLTNLAGESGGQLYSPTASSEIEGVYERIAEELRTQYHLGYVSSNPKRDGKWRRIVVQVAGRDDARLRHRAGYYGPGS